MYVYIGIPISASHSPSMSSFSSTSIPMSSPYGSIIQDSSSDYDHIPSQEETHTKLVGSNYKLPMYVCLHTYTPC